ncbi:Uncharacterised protein [Mycobacteroides abscessus subsp. abscessus]|nr:Uncharacterised protein [Mycobacteroides abscessus subsp. abscessus]
MLTRTDHRDLTFRVYHAAYQRQRNALGARQIRTGDRVLVFQQRRIGAAVHHLAAVLPRRRTDVHHPIGMFDGVLIMFDDYQCIAQIP